VATAAHSARDGTRVPRTTSRDSDRTSPGSGIRSRTAAFDQQMSFPDLRASCGGSATKVPTTNGAGRCRARSKRKGVPSATTGRSRSRTVWPRHIPAWRRAGIARGTGSSRLGRSCDGRKRPSGGAARAVLTINGRRPSPRRCAQTRPARSAATARSASRTPSPSSIRRSHASGIDRATARRHPRPSSRPPNSRLGGAVPWGTYGVRLFEAEPSAGGRVLCAPMPQSSGDQPGLPSGQVSRPRNSSSCSERTRREEKMLSVTRRTLGFHE
jgi:hypothetical protein